MPSLRDEEDRVECAWELTLLRTSYATRSDLRSGFFQLDGFHMDLGGSLFDKSELFGGTPAEVDDAFPRIRVVITGEGAAVIYSDDDRLAVFQVRHLDVDRQRQILVRRRQPVGVE